MKITVPTSWKGIKLKQYIDIRPILTMEANDIERLINLLCILLNKPRKEVEMLSINDYSKIRKALAFLDEDVAKMKLHKRFVCNGQNYRVNLDATKLTGGQYISVMQMLNGIENNENKLYENLPMILTAICVPIKRRWFRWVDVEVSDADYRKMANEFNEYLTMDIVLPIAVFFCNLWQNLTASIQDSLIEKAEKIISEVALENGVG